jgi:hypothetical protein
VMNKPATRLAHSPVSWDIDDFDLEDPVNQEIWTDSRALQNSIHFTEDREPVFSGGAGCQQAMLTNGGFDNDPLPWAPDIVGKDYGQAGSLLIVGSSYAPFIRGFGGRNAVSPQSYGDSANARAFQSIFFDEVVNPDKKYYGRIAGLADGVVPLKSVCLTDLCKGSFVERRFRNNRRHDKGGDGSVRKAASLYHAYVAHEASIAWLWNRITTGKASVIVALGSIAEHGMLKLFRSKECEIIENAGKRSFPGTALDAAGESGYWVKRYAEDAFKMRYWRDTPNAHWSIRHRTREWTLIPVYHPSTGWFSDRYIQKIKRIIGRILL